MSKVLVMRDGTTLSSFKQESATAHTTHNSMPALQIVLATELLVVPCGLLLVHCLPRYVLFIDLVSLRMAYPKSKHVALTDI
jgi:hypothetical protein